MELGSQLVVPVFYFWCCTNACFFSRYFILGLLDRAVWSIAGKVSPLAVLTASNDRHSETRRLEISIPPSDTLVDARSDNIYALNLQLRRTIYRMLFSQRSRSFNSPCCLESLFACDNHLNRVFPLHKLRPTYIFTMYISPPFRPLSRYDHLPQYAHFLPKYFPKYGTTTIVNNSSSCCKLSFHSLSASDSSPSSSLSSMSSLSAESGRESISSRSVV